MERGGCVVIFKPRHDNRNVTVKLNEQLGYQPEELNIILYWETYKGWKGAVV